MLLLVYIIGFLGLLPLSQANFQTLPSVSNLAHDNGNGTVVAISPREDMIAVGFADGTLKLLDLELNQLCESVSGNGSQINDLLWITDIEIVTLDMQNTITLWDENCQSLNSIHFNQQIIGIALMDVQLQEEEQEEKPATDTNNTNTDNQTAGPLIAANFKNRIEEYDILSGQVNQIYNIPQNQQAIEIIYAPDSQNGAVLLVSTNGSVVRKFQMLNATEVEVYIFENPIKRMQKVSVFTGDVLIGLASNNDVIRFNTQGLMHKRGNYPESSAMIVCQNTADFVLAYQQIPQIGVYLYTGELQQILASSNDQIQDIDCSESHLATVDDQGVVSVYTEEGFKSYIIGIIAGVIGGIVGLVVVGIVVIRLRQKWALEATQQQYSSTTPKKYPRQLDEPPSKQNSMKMLKLSTLQTTMRE